MRLSSRASVTAGLVLAFGSGFGVLTLEIAGARLLASTYGLSSIPWTAVIATVLGGLASGNILGGLATRGRRVLLPWLFLAAGGGSILAIVGETIPATLMSSFGYLGGALASAAAFFLAPSILMGAVTPMLVERATERVEEVGVRFGDIGAWSTAGAIGGTLLTGFVLLSHLPLPLVLALVATLFLLLAALAGVLEDAGRLVWVALGLSPLPIVTGLVPDLGPESVYAGQSTFASLRVADSIWYGDVPVREFWQNGSLSSAEHRVTGEPTQFYKITLAWLLSDRLDRIESVLVLGGAANTLPTQLNRMNSDLDLTVVEIDPKAVWVAREYFSYGQMQPDAISMQLGDARPFLRGDDGEYDVIITDVYDNLYSVPWHLVTQEAFAEMAARLKTGGLVTLTLSTPLAGPGTAFLSRIKATLDTVFPQVRVYLTQPEMPFERTQEVVVVAAREELDFPGVEWPWVEVPAEGPPLRDDFAPVEYLQAVRFLNDPAWR